jgi:hypothetical protein
LPINGFTVGRDISVTVAGPGGTTIIIPSTAVTHFEKRPLRREDWSRPLNVPPIPLYQPDGWRGNIGVDRQDQTLDTFQAGIEAQFWAGQNTASGTILETITEVNGSTTQYRYDNVMFWLEDPGPGTADRRVQQRLEWCAGTRKRVV